MQAAPLALKNQQRWYKCVTVHCSVLQCVALLIMKAAPLALEK